MCISLAIKKQRAVLVIFTLSIRLGGCAEEDKSYVAFEGGGVIFNYRIAEAYYGINLRPMRRLRPGTVLEVEFENPSGGEPYLVRKTVGAPKLRYTVRTPPVQGVKGNRDYRVFVRVLSHDGTLLATYTKSVHSDLDQSVLPKAPLVVGPGYHHPLPANRSQ